MSSRIFYESFPNPTDPTAELIKRRRLQILVHSCLYYELDANLIDDYTFDKWSRELVQLLKDHPGLYSDRFDKYFEGWDGTSGFDLPHRDPWVLNRASTLLRNFKS